MSSLLLSGLLALAAFATGVVGALTGLGGGIILVPMLVLLFDVNLRNAAGASLVAVIATSSGAAAAYLSEGYTNLRIGMFLQLPSIVGGIVGALMVVFVPARPLLITFAAVLLYSSYRSLRTEKESDLDVPSDPLAVRLKMESSYPTLDGWKPYKVYRVFPGFLLMSVAGFLSGLLGIGSGAINVLAMDQVMRLPHKVSTTTSNFMIGITAAASAGVYFDRGFIEPALTMPVMLGVFSGAIVGARILMLVRVKPLKIFFGVLVLLMALEMIYKGLMQRE